MGNRGCMTDAPQDRRSDGPPEAGGAAGATVDPAEVARFAALAGESFGDYGSGYVRFSFANSAENIEKALERIERFVASRT